MRRPRGKDRAHRAKPFAVRFVGGRWQVRQRKNWRRALELSLLAPTIGNGDGELHGDGVVAWRDGCAAITP